MQVPQVALLLPPLLLPAELAQELPSYTPRLLTHPPARSPPPKFILCLPVCLSACFNLQLREEDASAASAAAAVVAVAAAASSAAAAAAAPRQRNPVNKRTSQTMHDFDLLQQHRGRQSWACCDREPGVACVRLLLRGTATCQTQSTTCCGGGTCGFPCCSAEVRG